MTRLDSSAPDLADKLRRASLDKQRAAGVMACEFVITQAKLVHPLVVQALEKVRGDGVLTEEERAELDSLSAQLDEQYFVLQEAAEEGRASTEDSMRLFSQSRRLRLCRSTVGPFATRFSGDHRPQKCGPRHRYVTAGKLRLAVYAQALRAQKGGRARDVSERNAELAARRSEVTSRAGLHVRLHENGRRLSCAFEMGSVVVDVRNDARHRADEPRRPCRDRCSVRR